MKKKISKSECRKYAMPQFIWDQNNGLLHANQVKYIVRTDIKIIARQRLLILYVYSRQALEKGFKAPWLVMFHSTNEYTSLVYKEDGSTFWREASFDRLQKDSVCFSCDCSFYSMRDEERVSRYCKQDGKKGFDSLIALQNRLLEQKAVQRREAKKRKKQNRMKDVRAIPKDLKKWAAKEILPHYIFYDYEKGVKTGYCTACGHEVKVKDIKHNMFGRCPRCHKKIQYKSNGRKGHIFDQSTGQVIQKAGSDLVIRIFKFYCNYKSESVVPEISYRESARIFVKWGTPGDKIKLEPYYTYGYETEATEWRSGTRNCYVMYAYVFEADIRGYLYCRNLKKVLFKTPWQYSQMEEFYKNNSVEQSIQYYFERYIKYPFIEYLVKLGLYNLASDVVYETNHYCMKKFALDREGKNFREILGLGREYLPLLQAVNPNESQLKLIKTLLMAKVSLDVKLLKWCRENRVTDTENITVPVKYMTPHKLMRYIERQFILYQQAGKRSSIAIVLADYKDYISMCEGMEYNLKDDFICFPRDLAEAHEIINELCDTEKEKIYNNQIMNAYKALEDSLGFSYGKYLVTAPRSADDIIREGQILHHCVWRYVKGVAFHEYIILFVRHKDYPEEPLCTIQVKDFEIEEKRVFDNASPPPEIERFIELWKREVLQAPALEMAA